MRRVICCGVASIFIAVLFVAGCGGEYRDEPAEPPQAAAAAKLPDPGPEEAGQVEAFVRQWVAEQSGQDGVYNIPPRAGHSSWKLVGGIVDTPRCVIKQTAK